MFEYRLPLDIPQTFDNLNNMKTQYFVSTIDQSNTLKRIKNGVVNVVNHANVWVLSTYNPIDLQNKEWFRQVSRDEARKLHPATFRSVKKVQPIIVTAKPGLEMADIYRKAIAGLNYKGHEKITAIKAIRTIGYFGLAESLTIVENFDKFLAFIEEHNLLPRIGSRFDIEPFVFVKA